jgi:hypothetical protein
MFSCLIYHFQCATQKTIIASGMNFDGGGEFQFQFAQQLKKLFKGGRRNGQETIPFVNDPICPPENQTSAQGCSPFPDIRQSIPTQSQWATFAAWDRTTAIKAAA